jgi:hypothetical protein
MPESKQIVALGIMGYQAAELLIELNSVRLYCAHQLFLAVRAILGF